GSARRLACRSFTGFDSIRPRARAVAARRNLLPLSGHAAHATDVAIEPGAGAVEGCVRVARRGDDGDRHRPGEFKLNGQEWWQVLVFKPETSQQPTKCLQEISEISWGISEKTREISEIS